MKTINILALLILLLLEMNTTAQESASAVGYTSNKVLLIVLLGWVLLPPVKMLAVLFSWVVHSLLTGNLMQKQVFPTALNMVCLADKPRAVL